MEERIVIIPGRPKGYAEGKCQKCGYFAYIHGSEIHVPEQGGRFSSGKAGVKCGNKDCDAQIMIPLYLLPDDVEIN